MPCIRANHGDKELWFEIGSPFPSDEGIRYNCDVRFVGHYWDGDHEHPYCIHFDGLSLKQDEMPKLRDHLRNWLDQPLQQLAANALRGIFELANVWGQSVVLKIGPRDDTIDERKPVITVELKVGGVPVEMHFVTDQSCLAMFVDELGESMKCDPDN